MFIGLNRGKESIAIDLRTPQGHEVLADLVRRADVVIENFRPGVAARLGVDYPALQKINSKIIACSISGYGQNGPGADRPAYDVIIQAMGGGMTITGEPNRPPVRMGLPIADLSGGLFSVIGILSALNERNVTGRGQHIDIALLDCHVSLLSYFAAFYLIGGQVTRSVGSGHPSAEPYGAYPTQDGHVVIAVYNESFWPKLCAAVGHPQLATDPRFATNAQRVTNRSILREMLREIMTAAPTDHWVAKFTEAEVPAGPIYTIDRTLADPQVLHRNMVVNIQDAKAGSLRLTGNPVKLSLHPEPPSRSAPLLGEHGDAVLRDFLGYTPDQITQLRNAGCVK
jgi:crotonobetainyl-CoA:carnitine CoA-transferase CaiB-like acyl-CoA transferase